MENDPGVRRANRASQLCMFVAVAATVALAIMLAIYIGPRRCDARDNIAIADSILLAGCR